MKTLQVIYVSVLFSFLSLLATDLAQIEQVSMSSSFNNFNAIKAAVILTIGDAQAKGEADYIVYFWDGDSWSNPYSKIFWTPNLPIWGTQQYDDDVYIEGIAGNGNVLVHSKLEFCKDISAMI